MHAEIIAVGSELTSGARLDTNSQWLSVELAAAGIAVRFHTAVADVLEDMVAGLQAAVERSDLVVLTGGLGPTRDDLTRQALARYLGRDLVLDEPSLEAIRDLFARRRRTMPERNIIQAMFPAGSRPIPNPLGTAPGIWAEVSRGGNRPPCRIAALPGVPSEMKRMFRHEVLSRLSGQGRLIRRARVNCFGIGESAAEELLGDLTDRGRDPEVGITVHQGTITLRITAHGGTAEACREKIEGAERLIRERMGRLVFGVEDEELQDVIVRLLADRGETLATAESGTGGLLADRLTEVDGFERCYLGGVIVPTDAAKRELLGVEADLLRSAGPISAEAAAAMARGCRERFGADFALAVTECPRLDAEARAEAVGPAYLALAGRELLETREHTLVGDPSIAKSRAAKAALDLLRLTLLPAE